MPAYVIVGVDVTDPGAYTAYTREVPLTLEPYGGRFIVRGGHYEVIEGAWDPDRIVVLEFPDAARAHAWHASPAYQAILPIRHQNARTSFLLVVEGIV